MLPWEELTAEENLIATVARATCLTFRLSPEDTPFDDVQLYVDELVQLHQRRPMGVLHAEGAGYDRETVASTLRFCAQQLEDVAPDQAVRLIEALDGPGHGAV